ncbi:hypothetical protein GALL_425550 [mine drainage metagenome]|uniref:Uncharacterized protein n=1 Tax=mine drainage metagenome TaxID=410659 RepID=A0A1J5Q7D5_9ZZZZ
MNRCLTSLTRPFLGLALATALGLTPSISGAQDAVRQFPSKALRGIMEVTTPPEVLINGQLERLSPGAHIRGPDNLLVLSGSLVGQQLPVNYLRNQQAMIHDVWILNAAEARQDRAGLEPRVNFSFASDADKPKTDDGKTPFDQLPMFPRH